MVLTRYVAAGLVAGLVLLLAAFAAACGAPAAHAGGYQVTSVWGGAGVAPGDLKSPKGAAVAADGSVYVVDYSNHTLIKYSAAGEVLDVWGGQGTAPGQFTRPSRVALGPDGSVYVTDASNHRIQRFSPGGKLLSIWGRRGRGPGEFRYPRGIDVGPDGSVYVTDQNNCRVQVFTKSGRFLRMWRGSGRGRLETPKDVAVSRGGRVYVADAATDRVQVYTSAGRWLAAWGGHGSARGRFSGPRGVFVNARGHVFVADAMNDRIQEFTASGVFVREWGCRGTLPGLLREPRDVTAAPDGSLVVVDTHNKRLQRFVLSGSKDGQSPATTCDTPSAWSRTPLTVTLAAADSGSGVAVTYAAWGAGLFEEYGAPLVADTEGAHVLRFLSVDGAGNQEQVRRLVYRLDWTRPYVRPRLPAPLRCVPGASPALRFSVADRFSPECHVKVSLRRDGKVLWTRYLGWRRTSPSGAAQRLVVMAPKARGLYQLRVTARDRAGNRAVVDRDLVVTGAGS